MRRTAPPALFLLLFTALPAGACSFCAAGATRPPLREQFTKASAVALGGLSDARVNADGTDGRTTFTPTRVLKGALVAGKPVVLNRYLPAQPADGPVLVFTDAPPADPTAPTAALFATPASGVVADYLAASAKVAATGPARLGFAFARLADPDPAVRGDAFAEFAQASDADIAAAHGALKPDVLRKLLADPATPAEWHGVFAVLLGLSARPEDADYLHAAVTGKEPAAAVRDNAGAYLSALTLAAPAKGWPLIRAALLDPKRQYSERIAAVGAVRYLYVTRPALRADAAATHRALLGCADLADIAADDLRRWGRKEALPDVLAQGEKPTHAGRLVRRAFVRFALACPDAEAKAFVARVRAVDPKLVAAVETLPADPPPAP